jgi:MFS family permease
LPAVRRAVDASNGQLGLALLGVGLAALPAMVVAGRLADRAGPRLVPITLAAFAVAGVLPALAGSTSALFGLMLVLGATSGALDVAVNTRASAVEQALNVRVLDGVHAAFSAGVVVGGIGTGLLRHAGAEPRAILLGVGVVVSVVAAANTGADPLPGVPSARAALTRPLLIVGAVLALAFLIESGVENWSALFIENGLHASPAVSGLGPGLFAAAMVLGRAIAQRAAPESTTLRMAIAGGAAAAGLVVASSARHSAVALAGFVLAGAGLALSAPTLFRAAGRLGAGPAISTVAVLGYLGFTVGPPLIGGVTAVSGLRGGLGFLAAASAVLLATAPVLRRLGAESER